MTQRVGFSDIHIEYNRPVVHGRHLFGGLVKWGRIWHPGADSATTITFSSATLIEGQPLPYPGDSLDALRVRVTPETGQHMEVLAFYFPVVGPDSATLNLHWGTTVVPIRIKIPH